MTNSILELAFSDGSTPGLNYESRVTILEVNNLKLPKDDSTKISDHERNSIALMFALGAFCTHFGERNENEDTIEFFNEAWNSDEIRRRKGSNQKYENVLDALKTIP